MLEPTICFAQTRLIQWSDAHSTVETITKQVYAIDLKGKEFLKQNPKGEVVIHVIGDFTSIRPINALEGGWMSMEALRLLRERGYTVLFTPGNHDAFDWNVRVDGVALFHEQMRTLHDWGVKILATNLRKKKGDFKEVETRAYPLRSSGGRIEIYGLTIPTLMSKSGLTEEMARRIFGSIESFTETFQRVLKRASREGAQQVIFGIHAGHSKVRQQTRIIREIIRDLGVDIKVPLIMAAHDHRPAKYRERGIMISDAGSHGSFSVIDISADGKVLDRSARHVAINKGAARKISRNNFRQGHVEINRTSEQKIRQQPWLRPYHDQIKETLQKERNRLSRHVTHLREGIPENREHMKRGPSLLGNLISESLAEWARGIIPQHSPHPVVAMANSSSYHLTEKIRAGTLTEHHVRRIYPFLTEASLYLVDGHTLHDMYFSLRKMYKNGSHMFFSPHTNFGVREINQELYIRLPGQGWVTIDPQQKYWLALDGWLSFHREGKAYKIAEWVEGLNRTQPLAKQSYQDLLVEYLPRLFKQYEQRFNQRHRFRCSTIFY